jgi:hypothetical protein
VIGRPQGWREARHRLRRLTALTPSAHRSVGLACARPRAERGKGALDQLTAGVAAGIPLLPPREHRVEGHDQLAHAGDESHLGFFALGDQAIIEGHEDRVVQPSGANTGHVDGVSHPAAAATLDAAVAAVVEENVALLRKNNEAIEKLALALAPIAANYKLTKRRLALLASIGLGIFMVASWVMETAVKWAVGWLLKAKIGRP